MQFVGNKLSSMTEETTPLTAKKNSDEEHSLMRYYSWQLCAVFLFVVLGSTQALSTKASMRPDGQLPYDSSSAVAVAEGLKLVVALICIFVGEREQLGDVTAATWRREFGELSIVAFLFALQNELNFLVIQNLGASLFVLFGNLKIVFTCIFMRLIIGKHFAPLQWFAVCTLFLSAAIVKLPLVFGEGVDDETNKTFFAGMGMLLVATASSGLSSVQNELILKRKGTVGQSISFMAKNAVLYSWGVVFNMASWCLWGHNPFFNCFTAMGVVSILCLAGMGLSCAIILGYLDNVVRCFSSVAQVLMVVLLSRLLPMRYQDGEIDVFFVIALTFLIVALVIYQSHDSPRLWTYVHGAIFLSMLLGSAAMMFDRHTHQQ